MIRGAEPNSTAVRNACKLCTPLGACLAFRGIEGTVPLLHGSQGCATYIRRYLISHFREPVDIASSNFSESTAIFGGGDNFKLALANVIRQYRPRMIGVATTCLSETIGDDVDAFLREFRRDPACAGTPLLVRVSTVGYRGTHADGFHAAVRAVAEALAVPGERGGHVNLLPGIVSPADLRYLKEVMGDFGLETILLPDYSDTLDGGAWDEYHLIPPGGTAVADLPRMGQAKATIELGFTQDAGRTAGAALRSRCQVPHRRMGLPMGVGLTDEYFRLLAELSGRAVPARHLAERGRLIDSYVDGHKYVFGKKAVVFGEEDLVVGLTAMLREVGVDVVLCGSGGASGKMRDALAAAMPGQDVPAVMDDADFCQIEEAACDLKPDLLVGGSKGYATARRLDVPLVRVGFPVHDRLGGGRLAHLGYRGAQQIFDRLANALIEARQDASDVGYSYM
jgi:nitrogenase molybdenum-iron protein NifN